MKSKLNLSLYGLMTLILCTALLGLTSCGDDEPDVISGCTNPAADNYNANATMDNGSCVISGCMDEEADNYNPDATQDDGSCIPARDKFLGSYMGSFGCNGLLAMVANSDNLQFVISEGVIGDNTVSIQLLDNPLAFPLDATVAGDEMTISNMELGPFPFEVADFMVNAFIDANGTATYDSTTNTLSGTIIVNITDEATGVPLVANGECMIMGVKQ